MPVLTVANGRCGLRIKASPRWALIRKDGQRKLGPVANAPKSISNATRSKPDDPEQSKRFIEAARKAEADETEEGADRAFKVISKAPKKSD